VFLTAADDGEGVLTEAGSGVGAAHAEPGGHDRGPSGGVVQVVLTEDLQFPYMVDVLAFG
jgi:hypothetical protein